MAVTASDYRSLMLQIEELEEKVAELEKQNAELIKINEILNSAKGYLETR